eukprot:1389848-Amorphochlora_amoeboformis.AAC.2
MVNPKGKTKCITCQKPAPKLLRPKRQAKRAMTSGGHQPRSGKLSRKNRYQDVASRKSTYRAAKGNEELPLGPESKAWVVNEGDFLARRIKQIAVCQSFRFKNDMVRVKDSTLSPGRKNNGVDECGG